MKKNSSCLSCPPGTKKIDNDCIKCPSGYYSIGLNICYNCKNGYISKEGESNCTICPAGTYEYNNKILNYMKLKFFLCLNKNLNHLKKIDFVNNLFIQFFCFHIYLQGK